MNKTEQKTIVVGSDIGGSHISCAAVDVRTHAIIEDTFTQEDVNNKEQAGVIIKQWSKAILTTLGKAGIGEPSGVGLAMPGPFDYVNGIGRFEGVDKFEHLNGVDVGGMIRKELSLKKEVPIRFMNDATSFAVGAVWSDDRLEHENVLAITLGTGFGSAFIIDSLPVIRDHRVPEMGCLYHLPFREGIADETFSTRGIIKSYRGKSGYIVKGVKEIADRALTDEQAAAVLQQFGSELGHFLLPWIIRADIGHIIMGGNISRAYDLYGNAFESALTDAGRDVQIRIMDETELMAIMGSARLSDHSYWQKVLPLLKFM
ncbi:MAG: ROK family protein [Bacteroidales bacterium]|nr:ROK family protein [Bacteroidales bacterium]MBN2699033.1 ROK family protein [Bacteroidales bacterium]